MKSNTRKNPMTTLLATASLGLQAGCASMAVTEDALTANTASALGLQPGQFTISDRVDQGVKTTYTVTTTAGARYSCYVTGTVSVTGRLVSDALCNELKAATASAAPDAAASMRGAGAATAPTQGAAPAATPAKADDAKCNALLRAAGRCK